MKTNLKLLASLSLLLLFWVVACKEKVAEPVKSTEKTLLTFAFSSLSPAVDGTVSGSSITATVPFSTDLTKLVATIALSPKATVSPGSGVAQDFTNPVIYTVTAEDGSRQTYTVTVTKTAAPKSTAKNILTVSFNGTSPATKATVDTTTKTITALLPAGTDVTKLVPSITLSDKATVSPASGVAQDFTNPVAYTVTAEDGSKKEYTVKAATDAYYFSNIRMTVNETSDRLTDSCLVEYSTGTVFQLKDGAKYASRIDGLLNGYCGLDIYTPGGVIGCGASCGVGNLNKIIVGQKWSIYRKGDIQFITKNTVSTNDDYVSSDKWDEFSYSKDIAAFIDGAKYKLKADDDNSNLSNTDVASAAPGGPPCVPTVVFDKVLYRFITQDGKKGIMRMKQMGKKGSGYFLVFDIKIQK